MSTKTRTSIQTSSSRTVPAQGSPSLPRQRTSGPRRRPDQRKSALAIVTVLAGGIGAAVLWTGIGNEDAAEAPTQAPAQAAQVQQNADPSSQVIEQELLQRKLGQGASDTFEQNLVQRKLGQSESIVFDAGRSAGTTAEGASFEQDLVQRKVGQDSSRLFEAQDTPTRGQDTTFEQGMVEQKLVQAAARAR